MHGPIGRLEGLAVLAAIGAAMLFGLSAHPLHPDESQWIARSAPFEAFAAGRFSDPGWQDRRDRYLMAPVTYYAIGAGRRLGGWTPDRLNAPYRFELPFEANFREGRVPSPGLLAWSRGGVATCAALGIFLSFLVFLRAAGRPASYTWLALALVNPYLRATLQRAMNEGVLLGWIGLSAWAGLRALEAGAPTNAQGDRRRAAAWLAAGAAAAGAAAQTKLSGAAAAAGLIALACAASWRRRDAPGRHAARAAGAVTIVIAVSAAAFVTLNPTLWPDPVGGTAAVLRARSRMVVSQMTRFPGEAMPGLGERVLTATKRVFYDNSLVPGSAAGVALAAGGALLAVRGLARWRRGQSENHALAALAIVGGATAAPAVFTPLDWPRYYVLAVFFAGFLLALGGDWLVRRSWPRLRRALRRSSRAARVAGRPLER